MYLKRITQPTAEPITLEAAMRQCRVDGFGESPAHPDEPLITDLIPAARELAEAFTGRTLAESTWEIRYDCLSDEMRLARPPVTSVSSVTYIDSDGAEQTLDPTLWRFDDNEHAPAVRREYLAIYPQTRAEVGAVRIRFTAGPTDGDSPNYYPLPRPVYQAMALTIGHLYEHREAIVVGTIAAELPMGAEYLMRPYRAAIL